MLPFFKQALQARLYRMATFTIACNACNNQKWFCERSHKIKILGLLTSQFTSASEDLRILHKVFLEFLGEVWKKGFLKGSFEAFLQHFLDSWFVFRMPGLQNRNKNFIIFGAGFSGK